VRDMTRTNLDDTIAAISTPLGEGGIGIVRISGKNALRIADKIFISKDGKKPSQFKTYTVHYGHIVDNKCNRKSKGPFIIDEVILTVMRSPRSYTREDVVEINCHSGIVPLRKTLELVLENGGRLAEPGEFTKRAFLNGRIDAVQAESVLEIIKAKTELSLRAANNNLRGRLSEKISKIRNGLLDVYARLEAEINFPEEEDVVNKKVKYSIVKRLCSISEKMKEMLDSAREVKILRQGVRTVICGSPNVGKSSLMNALLKESRSIVTHIPGTTRDTIEEIVNIKGVPLILVDTAGITSSIKDPATKEGVKRSLQSIRDADLILLVLDSSRKLNKEDIKIMEELKDRDLIIVLNKIDLKRGLNFRDVRRFLPGRLTVRVSALKLLGIEDLESEIYNFIFKGKAPSPDLVSLSNARQCEALQRSMEEVNLAIEGLDENKSVPIDCISIYIRSAIEEIDRITGGNVTEEMLDTIFSEFCIGK